MAEYLDIVVRRGAGRPHRVNISLDRLRERLGSPNLRAVGLRIVVEANLPRGRGRPPRLEYQRIASYLLACRTGASVSHVLAEIRNLVRELDHIRLVSPNR